MPNSGAHEMTDAAGPPAHPARSPRADRRDRRRGGDVPGDDEPRLRGGIALSRSDPARGRSQGRLGAHSRRGARGHDRGVSNSAAPATRCRCSNTTAAPAAATGRSAAATSIPNSAAPPRPASSTRGTISIPDRGAFPITTTRSWITAAGSASRSSLSSSSITTPVCIRPRRSAASRSASARSRPISRARSRTAGQGDAQGRARRGGVERGSGDSARGAARARRPRQRLSLSRGRRIPRSSAATRGIPAAASAPPVNGEPIGLHEILTSRLWRGLQSFLAVTNSRPRCSSRSAAWAGSARRSRARCRTRSAMAPR